MGIADRYPHFPNEKCEQRIRVLRSKSTPTPSFPLVAALHTATITTPHELLSDDGSAVVSASEHKHSELGFESRRPDFSEVVRLSSTTSK